MTVHMHSMLTGAIAKYEIVVAGVTKGVISESTVYVSPGCMPHSITLVLLTAIGDWSELIHCV